MAFAVAEQCQLDKVILQDLDVVGSTNQHAATGLSVVADDGRGYSYLPTCSTVTGIPIAGYPAFWTGAIKREVTSTQKDGYGHNFAGVFCAAIGAGNATPGVNYLWVQTKGYVPSAAASTGAGAVLVANTGRFIEATTSTCTGYDANAVGLQTHSSQVADIMLVEK